MRALTTSAAGNKRKIRNGICRKRAPHVPTREGEEEEEGKGEEIVEASLHNLQRKKARCKQRERAASQTYAKKRERKVLLLLLLMLMLLGDVRGVRGREASIR